MVQRLIIFSDVKALEQAGSVQKIEKGMCCILRDEFAATIRMASSAHAYQELDNTMRIITLILFSFILSYPVLAFEDKEEYEECFKILHTQFESKSWKEIISFRRETRCKDSAVYEEVWSDIITYNIETKWELLPDLAALAPIGSEERSYLISRIDVTCPLDRCNNILEKSINACPKGQEILCKEIQQRIIEIDQEENSPNEPITGPKTR